MKNYVNLLFKKVILASFVCAFGLSSIAQEVEEVVVTAEKRSESLQDISQAVTALTATDIEEKYNQFCRPKRYCAWCNRS
jgi:outer membrane cobalamin receptor